MKASLNIRPPVEPHVTPKHLVGGDCAYCGKHVADYHGIHIGVRVYCHWNHYDLYHREKADEMPKV